MPNRKLSVVMSIFIILSMLLKSLEVALHRQQRCAEVVPVTALQTLPSIIVNDIQSVTEIDLSVFSVVYGSRPSICCSMSATSVSVDCTSSCTNCNRIGIAESRR